MVALPVARAGATQVVLLGRASSPLMFCTGLCGGGFCGGGGGAVRASATATRKQQNDGEGETAAHPRALQAIERLAVRSGIHFLGATLTCCPTA